MSDENEPIRLERRTFAEPMFAELDVPPMTGYVVHRVSSAPTGLHVWAWCEVVQGFPGYRSVTFTKPDGITATDPHPDNPSAALTLAPTPLFQVWC
jgi:hypothetical protein